MNNLTIIGNIGKDPELAFSASGKAVCKMTVATKNRNDKNVEEATIWHDVVAFGELAENTVASVQKGDRVIVIGRLEKRAYEKRDGGKGLSVELIANEIGVNLRFCQTEISRMGGTTKNAHTPTVKNDSPEEPF